MLTRERRIPESASAVHSLRARIEEAIVRKEHRAIVDKRVDAPRGVGVINCLLILLSLHEMVTIAREKERRKGANE